METLKELLKEQKQAQKRYDYKALREINLKIFAINENERKKKEKQKELDRDNRTNEKINNILKIKKEMEKTF